MSEEVYDEANLRKYLLGELNEVEQQALEERLMADGELFGLLPVAEDELIDDYLGDALGAEERARFDSFFLLTPERRRKLSFAMALRRYVTTEAGGEAQAARPAPRVIAQASSWWRQAFSTPFLRLAAAAIIVLGLGMGIWRVFWYQSEVAKGMAALARAYRNERPVEARISGLDYAPFANVRGNRTNKVDSTDRDRAERILLDAVFANPTPATFHALGKLYLAEQRFDKAIEQFEKALEGGSNNAQLQSDYGAAFLEKGKADHAQGDGKRLEALARSLEHLSKALELDGSLLEALFNRALCYQNMFLPLKAEEDWHKYLERDQNSKWADEARQKLNALEEQKQKTTQNREQVFRDFIAAYQIKDHETAWKIICQNREFSGNFVENRLLDEHLDLTIKGQVEQARERLLALSYAAELEASKAFDHYVSDLVGFYKLTTTERKRVLAQARDFMNLGHEKLNSLDPEEALSLYDRAERIFVREGDACEAAYVRYPIAHCYLLQRKDELGLTRFQKLVAVYEEHRFKWLLGQTLDAIGNACTGLRDFSMAIRSSDRSLKLSEEMGDINGVIKTLGQMGAEYSTLNNHDKSLDLYARRLALAQMASPGALQQWRHYFTVARALDHIGLFAAAIDYQKEALRVAVQGQMPQLASRSYTHLGVLYGNTRDYDSAIKNIQIALDLSKSFSDKEARMDYAAYAFLHLGNVYKQEGDFDKALPNYDQAIQLYSELDSKYFNYVSRKSKLLCCITQGRCPSIEQEIEATIELFEKDRGKIQEESNRNTYFDAEQSIYDVAIDFAYSAMKDSRRAFEYSEACRARSLHDLISTNIKIIGDRKDPDIRFETISRPKNIEDIRGLLRDNAQILQYAVLKDKVLMWLVSKERSYDAVERISLESLNDKVSNYLRQIASPSEDGVEEATALAQDLYDVLIKPVEYALDSKRSLCIVPDKALNYLPFGALISATSKKYFIEEHDFVLSPSANIFVICSEAAREKTDRRNESLLCVGNPRFDNQAFDFGDLPSAAQEAETIARYYGARAITGRSATKALVESEMEKSDVIHLAMHCVVNELSPLRSKLLLAKDRKGGNSEDDLDGVLYAYEIYKLNLSRARVVVLSACQTGVERYYGGEGMIGISRPFIAKRVPLVIASLWPVNSDSAAELMVSLHKHRKSESGMTTAKALRRAQLDMLSSADPSHRSPYHWASFVAIGGYAEF